MPPEEGAAEGREGQKKRLINFSSERRGGWERIRPKKDHSYLPSRTGKLGGKSPLEQENARLTLSAKTYSLPKQRGGKAKGPPLLSPLITTRKEKNQHLVKRVRRPSPYRRSKELSQKSPEGHDPY